MPKRLADADHSLIKAMAQRLTVGAETDRENCKAFS